MTSRSVTLIASTSRLPPPSEVISPTSRLVIVAAPPTNISLKVVNPTKVERPVTLSSPVWMLSTLSPPPPRVSISPTFRVVMVATPATNISPAKVENPVTLMVETPSCSTARAVKIPVFAVILSMDSVPPPIALMLVTSRLVKVAAVPTVSVASRRERVAMPELIST